MKHYVVLCDSAVDHMGYDETHVTAVTHTLEEAKVVLAKAVVEDRQYAIDHGWKIYTDNDEEFDAGEDGYYATEHTHFYIEKVDDVEDDEYTPSSTNGDYSPSNPWDAPGMKLSDFI